MNCRNCGREFDGRFCPDCGTPVEEPIVEEAQEEEVVEQPLLECPVCGSERVGEGKFCVNCGFNYEEGQGRAPTADVAPAPSPQKRDIKLKLPNVLGVVSKVYRYLIAGGMLFVGLIAFLCLTSPTITEEFFGMKNNLCTGFVALGGGANCDVPSSVSNACRVLLILSILALAYGGWQTYLAIKKPYRLVNKYQYWIVDGAISLALIILGGIVSSVASSEGTNGKAGSGFAMCVVMGVFGLIFLAARVYYELKVFKWADTGLTDEQIAKSLEKKPKKQRPPKEKKREYLSELANIETAVIPEVRLAKKRKRRLLALDWIIALIPIIFVSIMLIIMFTPSRSQSSIYRIYMLYGGSGLGLMFFICVFIRLVNEVKVYKWVDPYPSKKLTTKQKVLIPLVLVVILAGVIVPSVMVSTNIFRVGKVEQINLGDDSYYVTRLLGEPTVRNSYVYEYYSSDYVKLNDQIENTFDFDTLEALSNKLESMTYKYIRVTFDSKYAVTSVLLDKKKCDGNTNPKKSVKTYQTLSWINKGLYAYEVTYWVKYSDGSYYLGSATATTTTSASFVSTTLVWEDIYGNEFKQAY